MTDPNVATLKPGDEVEFRTSRRTPRRSSGLPDNTPFERGTFEAVTKDGLRVNVHGEVVTVKESAVTRTRTAAEAAEIRSHIARHLDD